MVQADGSVMIPFRARQAHLSREGLTLDEDAQTLVNGVNRLGVTGQNIAPAVKQRRPAIVTRNITGTRLVTYILNFSAKRLPQARRREGGRTSTKSPRMSHGIAISIQTTLSKDSGNVWIRIWTRVSTDHSLDKHSAANSRCF